MLRPKRPTQLPEELKLAKLKVKDEVNQFSSDLAVLKKEITDNEKYLKEMADEIKEVNDVLDKLKENKKILTQQITDLEKDKEAIQASLRKKNEELVIIAAEAEKNAENTKNVAGNEVLEAKTALEQAKKVQNKIDGEI